jgi:O-antigen chain-terminating methyltransferase
VKARYPEGEIESLKIPLPDLMPVLHARDAAEGKVAAIGTVNPRPGGPLNATIQFFKHQIARALGWFVRDQVEFNRATVNSMHATLEALNEVNRTLVALGDKIQVPEALRAEAAELKDIRAHWMIWRESWEKRLHRNEAHFLRSVAELNASFEHRLTTADAGFRDSLRIQHADFVAALERSTKDIQDRLWGDLERIRLEYERLIHYELRLVRQQRPTISSSVAAASVPGAEGFTDFDYTRFAEKFRGGEEYVRKGQRFFLPYFTGRRAVLDIGCGRGEFLDLMREAGVPAQGIDLDSASVEMCRAKELSAEVVDLFELLGQGSGTPYDGIFASQLVEHLPPEQLPRMVKLCAARLKPGGVLALETPNPECLAIFATHFYIDPTHTRPIPPALLSFYFEEFGFGRVEVHRRFPAEESMPELRSLPEDVRAKFFGGLDYSIIGYKL